MDSAWDTAAALIEAEGETDTTARQLLALAEAAPEHIEQHRKAFVARSAAAVARRCGCDDTVAVAALVRDRWNGLVAPASA